MLKCSLKSRGEGDRNEWLQYNSVWWVRKTEKLSQESILMLLSERLIVYKMYERKMIFQKEGKYLRQSGVLRDFQEARQNVNITD